MSSDRSAVAFEPLAASQPSPASGGELGEGERRLPIAGPACDLAELASALAQVEALVSAAADQSSDAVAAVERIADIAFVLHEREVEPSLCDALDAAMREIGAANARNRASAERAQEAGELLRALAQRLDAMIAAQAEAANSGADLAPAAGALHGLPHNDELECADEFPAPARLFDADVAEDSAFAQTVAALAESLPVRSEAAPPYFQDDVGTDAAPAPEAAAPPDDKLEQAKIPPDAWPQAEKSVSGMAEECAPLEGRVEAKAAASIDAAEPPADAPLPPAAVPHHAIDPDEDPGDLFEPTPGMRTAAEMPVALPAMAANSIQETLPAANLAPAPRAAAGAAHAASRPAANDPLAPIRALSEEELIALFS